MTPQNRNDKKMQNQMTKKWQKNDKKMTKINNQQPSEFAGKIFIRLNQLCGHQRAPLDIYSDTIQSTWTESLKNKSQIYKHS